MRRAPENQAVAALETIYTVKGKQGFDGSSDACWFFDDVATDETIHTADINIGHTEIAEDRSQQFIKRDPGDSPVEPVSCRPVLLSDQSDRFSGNSG